jgi:RNA polymerase sigma-70 factor (ECF subfamily)
MDKSVVGICYNLANEKQIRLEVSIDIKELLEQSDRQLHAQKRQDRRRHMEYIDGLVDTNILLPQEDFADLIFKKERYQRLYAAIAKLSEVQRRRLLMYYFGDLTYRQIAELEGVGFKTVAQTVKRAIETLRKIQK